VSFLDKLLVGTALNIAYVYMALFLWALVRWLGDGRRDALAWLALGAAGMMFFHSVVGLSVIPVALAVLGAAWLMRGSWSWLPSRGALLAAAVSAGVGALLSLPYMRSITAGWAPEKAGFHHRYLEFHPEMIWTLATACFFALWFVRRPLADVWRRREPLALLLAAWTAGMAVFACAVSLPMHNSVKFVLEFFVGCLALAAPAAAEGVAASWKSRRVLAPVALFLIFGVPTLLTLHGYLVDPTGRTRAELHPRTGEESVYAWLRHETPLDAVLVDGGFRDLIMVKARRRLYMATEQPADLAAFPVAEMARRHRIMLDLYGSIAEPDTDVAGLADLHQPIYLLFRPEDRSMWLEPWKRVIDAAPGSQLVYDRDGYRIVRLFARSVS
jgi:hypothetical protein